MSENKKFTEDELKEISALRDANAQKVSEFGQIELELLITSQRKDFLIEAKDKLKEDYKNLQNQERDLVQKLNEKYGPGTVDVSNGEFIPAN